MPPPPPVIPMPPRPPGPPLLRKIQPLKEKPPEKLSLKVGDKAVHPRHGVSEVMALGPPGLGWSIDWLSDGRLLVTGDQLLRHEPDRAH